jgi:hypothetical protein
LQRLVSANSTLILEPAAFRLIQAILAYHHALEASLEHLEPSVFHQLLFSPKAHPINVIHADGGERNVFRGARNIFGSCRFTR